MRKLFIISISLVFLLTQCNKNKEVATDSVPHDIQNNSKFQLILYTGYDYDDLALYLTDTDSSEAKNTPKKYEELSSELAHRLIFSSQIDIQQHGLPTIYNLTNEIKKQEMTFAAKELVAYSSIGLFCYLSEKNHAILEQSIDNYLEDPKNNKMIDQWTAEVSVLSTDPEVSVHDAKPNQIKEIGRFYESIELNTQQSDSPAIEIRNQYKLKDNTELTVQHKIRKPIHDKIYYRKLHQNDSEHLYSRLILRKKTTNFSYYPKCNKQFIGKLKKPSEPLPALKVKQLYSRAYQMPPDFITRIGSTEIDGLFSTTKTDSPIENAFSSLGINIIEGGSIRFIPSTSTLFATLDSINLDRLESIIHSRIGQGPPTQNQINIKLLKLPLSTAFTPQGNIDYTQAEVVDTFGGLHAYSYDHTNSINHDTLYQYTSQSSRVSYTPTLYKTEFNFHVRHLSEPIHVRVFHSENKTLYSPLSTSTDGKSLIAIKIDLKSKLYKGEKKKPIHLR